MSNSGSFPRKQLCPDNLVTSCRAGHTHAAVLARYQEPFAGPCSFTTVTSETDVVVAAGVRGSVLLREAESAKFSVVEGRWTQGLLMDSRE